MFLQKQKSNDTGSAQSISRSAIETELLQAILTDNKKIANELKLQLDTIEQLQNENETLKAKLKKILKESELCMDRDELHLKRNARLNRENKILKDKVELLSKHLNESARKFELEKKHMLQSHEEERQQILWQNEKLHMDTIKLQTQLEQKKKELQMDEKRKLALGQTS